MLNKYETERITKDKKSEFVATRMDEKVKIIYFNSKVNIDKIICLIHQKSCNKETKSQIIPQIILNSSTI